MMSDNIFTYKVAENIFRFHNPGSLAAWKSVESHYRPFLYDSDAGGEEVVLDVKFHAGSLKCNGLEVVFDDEHPDPASVNIRIYRSATGLIFELQQPATSTPNGWIEIDTQYRTAAIHIDENNSEIAGWKHVANLTSCIMLAYLLATTGRHTLMGHASCIVKDGVAYLFIGKSGTGKSTHSRLWLRNIPQTLLLNDDHPIIRVDGNRPEAYGSPWSGKTDCYVNDSAPVQAIVRLAQAPANEIRHLAAVPAYASLISSFSGIPFLPDLADERHDSIEKLVASVPCYLLDCLPDAEAALLSYENTKPLKDI